MEISEKMTDFRRLWSGVWVGAGVWILPFGIQAAPCKTKRTTATVTINTCQETRTKPLLFNLPCDSTRQSVCLQKSPSQVCAEPQQAAEEPLLCTESPCSPQGCLLHRPTAHACSGFPPLLHFCKHTETTLLRSSIARSTCPSPVLQKKGSQPCSSSLRT